MFGSLILHAHGINNSKKSKQLNCEGLCLVDLDESYYAEWGIAVLKVLRFESLYVFAQGGLCNQRKKEFLQLCCLI